eukprot:TRINITY_DN217_c0_g1_i2.p1 TRINITY_DN217_c0_g1~~TRINITY_DN217_c0_g1_i2.p1  ORF type:complete len:212 (+),score=76.87 TRINITY_DN217_c0_g1_i2:40-675(+)
MEGGSIHVDGEGTLLTTEECLLNPNRNPNLSREQIEQYLKDYLAITKVIWLPNGLVGDEDTNGHVDNIACFARPGEVVLAWCDDPSNPQHAISVRALEILQQATDAKGRSLTIHKLHIPRPIVLGEEECKGLVAGDHQRVAGTVMAASYVNFYIANKAIIVPAFGDDIYDAQAVQTLQRVFPHHTIRSVQTRDIILGGGNIHCITQQQPGK